MNVSEMIKELQKLEADGKGGVQVWGYISIVKYIDYDSYVNKVRLKEIYDEDRHSDG